jgi:hypothetical protein
MYNLGVMYAHGQGVSKDEIEAVSWFRKAAEGGNTNAMYNLGISYANGRGVPKDEREAVSWFRKGAEGGDANTMYNLGLHYYLGRGVPQDYMESYVWFSLAAAFGNEKAIELRKITAKKLTTEARLTAQKRSQELFDQIRNQSKD